jgi:hypothetical protein
MRAGPERAGDKTIGPRKKKRNKLNKLDMVRDTIRTLVHAELRQAAGGDDPVNPSGNGFNSCVRSCPTD